MFWKQRKCTYYEGESNEKLKYFIPRNLLNTKGTAEHHGRYGVLIHDSYPDARLFHSLLRGDYSFTMASTAAMDSGVTTRCAWPGRGASVTELTPFMYFLLHSYTCCSDRHSSPYWTFIRLWISMGFNPSELKKTSDRKLFLFGASRKRGRHFTLLLRRNVAFLHCTATCRPLFKPRVSLLPTYRTIGRCFAFLSQF